jgi:hypothetical protein
MHKTADGRKSGFDGMSYRTFMKTPKRRHLSIDSRDTLGFNHNPNTNLFEFNYKPKPSKQ